MGNKRAGNKDSDRWRSRMQGLKRLDRRGNTHKVQDHKFGENFVILSVMVAFVLVLCVIMMMIADGLGFDVSTWI